MENLFVNSKLDNILAVAEHIANDVKEEKVYVGYNPEIVDPFKKGVCLKPEYMMELIPLMNIILCLGSQNFGMDKEFMFMGKKVKSNILVWLVFTYYEYQVHNVYPYQVARSAIHFLLSEVVAGKPQEASLVSYLTTEYKLIYIIDRLNLVNRSKNGIIVDKWDIDKLVTTIYRYNVIKEFLEEDVLKDVFVIDKEKKVRGGFIRLDLTRQPTRFILDGKNFMVAPPLYERYTADGVRYYEQIFGYPTGVDSNELPSALKCM